MKVKHLLQILATIPKEAEVSFKHNGEFCYVESADISKVVRLEYSDEDGADLKKTVLEVTPEEITIILNS